MPGVGDAGTGHCVKQQRSPASLSGASETLTCTSDLVAQPCGSPRRSPRYGLPVGRCGPSGDRSTHAGAQCVTV